jgi:hypothetical protein
MIIGSAKRDQNVTSPLAARRANTLPGFGTNALTMA